MECRLPGIGVLVGLGLCTASVCLTGCSHEKRLAYAKAGFSVKAVDRVYIMPPVEGRAVIREGEKFPELSRVLTSKVESCLKSMGYAADTVPSASNLSAEQIAFADASVIHALGPADARWVMVPVLDSAHPSPILVGASFGATIYLFDKKNAELVWEGNGISDYLSSIPRLILEPALHKK